MLSLDQSGQTLCSTCGVTNASASRFCSNCGAPLGVPASAYADTVTGPRQDLSTFEVTTHDKLAGTVIDGRYRIKNLIGVGGMGSVYCATRVMIGDDVAIKILHTERIADPHAAERFRREAQAAARLKHANAVSIYDFGISSDGLQYLVMELVEGESLRQVIKQEGTLEPSIAAEITAQTCAALDEAHRQHIVHRDIKPDNIIVNSAPGGLRVKVLDFGIAKLRDDAAGHLTQTGSVMGTPHYMSPEQCLGEELDARADIYSMGIVLYEMLCGRVPFDSPISTAVVVQHVNQPPPSLRSLNGAISSEVESVVLNSLRKERDTRPMTAGAFAHSLLAAVNQPITTREGPTLQPSATPPPPLRRTTAEDILSSHPTLERISEMPPTIHLAGLRGSTEQLASARTTGGNGTVTTGVITQAAQHKYVLALVFLILITGMGVIAWRSLENDGQTSSDVHRGSGTASGKFIANNPPPGMVYIPGGTFLMGSSEGDQDSRPVHSASVKSFFLDVHEVTSEEYKKFIDATGHGAPASWSNGNYPPGSARHPVTGVNWHDANAYARWAGKRLPTEEEWEFAARSSKALRYPWGNSWKPGCSNADTEGEARKGMAAVGSHDCGSPFGVADLIGNAWEWTASDWVPYPGGRLQFPTKGGEKVIRGGSWESSRQYANGFYRSGLAQTDDASGYNQTGFRCARDVDN